MKMNYMFEFRTERRGFRHVVIARDTVQLVDRDVAGPFWSLITALRIEGALTQWFRTGTDISLLSTVCPHVYKDVPAMDALTGNIIGSTTICVKCGKWPPALAKGDTP